MIQDFSKRMAIVVRKDIEPWQVTNTIAHIAAKVGRAIEQFETGESFVSSDGVSIPRNSQYPIVVFQTEGPAKLHTLLEKVREAKLPHLAYVREMIDFADDEELRAALAGKPEAEFGYLGVGVFGDNELLKQLTKKFSLWR